MVHTPLETQPIQRILSELGTPDLPWLVILNHCWTVDKLSKCRMDAGPGKLPTLQGIYIKHLLTTYVFA